MSIRLGIAAYLNKDYVVALDFFDRAIEELETINQSNEWAYAYKGETLFSIAQKMEDYGQVQLKQLNEARYWFNRALGLEADDINNPEVQISLSNKEPWIVAHRGELLRVTANKMIAQDQKKTRDTFYKEATNSFEEATSANNEYAWAYAHWGATLYNKRGSVRDYEHALYYTEKAIELSKYNYAWAYVNKASIMMEMDRPDIAYYDLLIAYRQDPNILNQGTQPPYEFNTTISLGRRYGEAIWQYQVELEQQPKDEIQISYILYNKLKVFQNIPKETFTTSTLEGNRIQRARDLESDLLKHLGLETITSAQEITADAYYMIGGMQSLQITEEVDERRVKDSNYPALHELDLHVEKGGKNNKTSINYRRVRRELKKTLREMDAPSFSGLSSNDENGIWAGFDEKPLNEKLKEWGNKAYKALRCLEYALNISKNEKNSFSAKHSYSEYQHMARVDVAWYYLRPLSDFQNLVNAIQAQ